MPCLAICGNFEGDAERRFLFVLDVAHLAGVPDSIVTRAESVSKEFFADLQEKLARRRRSKLSSIAQAGAFAMLTSKRFHRLKRFLCLSNVDFAFLVNVCDPKNKALQEDTMKLADLSAQLDVIRRSIKSAA